VATDVPPARLPALAGAFPMPDHGPPQQPRIVPGAGVLSFPMPCRSAAELVADTHLGGTEQACMKGFVGAQHEFHDADFVQGWADRFVPSPPRLALFDMILAQIRQLPLSDPNVLELGLGPGYMARHILQHHHSLRYEGLDFSAVFFDVAKRTLGELRPRVTLTQADLLDRSWPTSLARRPHAIISTWALHDLGSQQAVADVYARCYEILPEGGILVNGDFIRPEDTAWEYEAGRFEVTRHLEFLRQAGFAHPVSLHLFEPETDNPTPAQNYACLVAAK
jgi:SAM-dependent methyltransferase